MSCVLTQGEGQAQPAANDVSSRVMKVYISQFVGPTTLQSMPLAAGLLAASARRDPRLREAVEFRIVTSRIDPDDAVDRYIRPDILAFSCYTWNGRYTLEVARRSTLRFPDALCVLGGPSVPRGLRLARG